MTKEKHQRKLGMMSGVDMKLSKEDLNAIMFDKAVANTNKASFLMTNIAWMFGSKIILKTHSCEYEVSQFFGKQYA